MRDLVLAFALYGFVMLAFSIFMGLRHPGDIPVVFITYGAILFVPGLIVAFIAVKVARLVGS